MSGSQHPLFSNAPITPQAPTLPVVPPGSNLAAVLSQPHPLSLSAPSFGSVPLASMMQMMRSGNPSDPNAGQPIPPADPYPSGTSPFIQPTAASDAAMTAPQQAQMPGTPADGVPGLPSMGAPGMASAPAPGMPGIGAPGTPTAGQPGALGQGWDLLQRILSGGGNAQ